MPTWEKIGDLMNYRGLNASGAPPSLTLAYRFKDMPTDPWTARLNAFKEGDRAAIRGACKVMPNALKTIRFPVGPVTLTAAISSASTSLDRSCPVAQLGAAIASALGWAWKPQILMKRPHQKLHYLTSALERANEVDGVYTARNCADEKMIVVLDDFITRGDTLADIVRAIKQVNYQVPIYGVALGKTERLGYWENAGANNGHVPAAYAALWDNA